MLSIAGNALELSQDEPLFDHHLGLSLADLANVGLELRDVFLHRFLDEGAVFDIRRLQLDLLADLCFGHAVLIHGERTAHGRYEQD